MRIQTKLRAVALLPFLVFLVSVATETWLHAVTERDYAKRALITDLNRAAQNLLGLTYEYAFTQGERAASQWRNQYAAAALTFEDMPPLFDHPAEVKRAEELRLAFEKSEALFRELVEHDAHPLQEPQAALSSRVRRNLLNRTILELQALRPLTGSMHEDVVAAIKRTTHSGYLLNAGMALALAIGLLVLSLFITRGIARSLDGLQHGILEIARGNLAHRVGRQEQDEIGELGRGLDVMTEQLAELTVSRDDLSREVAERRHAEESLAASESRLRQAQRMAHVGNWRLDLRTNTLSWSEEIYRIFEIDPQRFGASYEAFLNAIHPEDREKVNQAYHDSLLNKTPYALEHRLLMQDGRVKFVQEQCETEFAPDGAPLFSLGTVQDITARKQAELALQRLNEELEARVASRTADLAEASAELRNTQRALMSIVEDLNQKTIELEAANLRLTDIDRLKSMFIASMSHELRTPLNSIIGFSSVVLDEWLGPLNDKQRNKLAIVLRTGKHLLALINDIIDISKIEAGKLECIPVEFDLSAMIREVATMVEVEATAKGLALEVRAFPRVVRSDRRRLYQCLANLLSNAVKFTRQGTITVIAETVEEKTGSGARNLVRITVRDTGIGIGKEDLPRIFGSFVRLQLPDDMQVKGTGLGLYLVKKIVTELLGGTITVESVLGKGSEFCISLPVGDGQEYF